MKNLSPQTRQKLAILLKSKERQTGGLIPKSVNGMAQAPSPNLAPPPPILNAPFPMSADKMDRPARFGLLKKRFSF